MVNISNRLDLIEESQTLAMSQKSRKLIAQGVDVVNLSIGEPDFNTPDFIKEAAHKAIDENYSHYSPVSGFLELREAISNKFKRDNKLDYSKDQIVVSTGAKQSLMNVVLSTVNPNDEVILPAPFWVSYKAMVDFAQGKMVKIDTEIENNFKITPDQLEKAITTKTKLFIFSSPCNPSGSVYTHDELSALAEVFASHPDIIIISDEIYEHINFTNEHCSIGSLENIKNPVVTVNGLSKGFAMTGWRIGYIGAPTEIAKACKKIQGQFTSGANSIAQMTAIAALNADPEVTKDMRATFLKRRDMVIKLLKDIDLLKVNVPEGAFYAFPNVEAYFGKSNGDLKIKDAEDLSNYLLDEAHVSTVCGDAFGKPGSIRLSYAASEKQLKVGIQRMKEALSKLK